MTYPLHAMFLLTIVAATGAVHAADSKPPAEIAFATREQYRACLDMEDKLKACRQALDAKIAENHASLQEMQREGDKIVATQANLQLYDDVRVREFNTMVERHNEHVKAINAHADAARAEELAYNADSREYNKRCAAMVFRIQGRDAVLKERKALVK